MSQQFVESRGRTRHDRVGFFVCVFCFSGDLFWLFNFLRSTREEREPTLNCAHRRFSLVLREKDSQAKMSALSVPKFFVRGGFIVLPFAFCQVIFSR